jgi:hypothetical protein
MIARMMAKDPNDRFATPLAVANFLVPWTSVPIPPPADDEMPTLCPKIGKLDLSGINLGATPEEAEADMVPPAPAPAPKREEAPPETKTFTAADLMRGMDW